MEMKETDKSKKIAEIKKGDFVLVSYTGYILDTGEVFDTTYEEEAKKAGIYNPRHRYGPTLTIVGENWLVEGLEESLIGKTEGCEYEIVIPPEKGYGIRDSKKIKTTTIKKLREAGVKGNIMPGLILEVDGRPAIVRAVVSGRVMLDFNPPLAGKRLKYRVKIEKVLKSDEERINALINHYSREIGKIAKIELDKSNKTLTINLSDEGLKNPSIQAHKRSVAEAILKYVKLVEKVRFIDELVRKEAKSEELPRQA